MCGVVGFWDREGAKADEAILERMVERILHRGPDDQGTWAEGPVGLGHCRLSILDLSPRGHQPFLTQDGMGVLSYNGEVYNFKELRTQLEKEGVRFRSTTDTEVVLYALHYWGPEKAVPLFNGMFAFAYFDLRTKTLWLGRDKSGIKPLYITHAGSMVAFASEIKALFGHPEIPCRPDLHALTTQLLYERLDGEWTVFENVKSLIPGTIVKITATGEKTIEYFDLLSCLNVDRLIEARRVSFNSRVDEFEDLFSKSVKMHLISEAPLAAMTSGGLDSSLITAVAKKYKPDIVGYVADIPDLKEPEVPRAIKVCKHVGVELRRVKIDHDDFLRLWPAVIYQNDQPNFFSQNVLTMGVTKAASRDGFKVLLTGEGSDELFGGYPWQAEVYKMWRWRRFHSYLFPNIAPLRALGGILNKFTPLDLNTLNQRPFEHLSNWNHSGKFREFLAIDAGQRSLRQEQIFDKLKKIEPVEERAFLARAFEDFYCHLQNDLTSIDKMGMAQSIELRVPFIENALLDFAMHLPCNAKFHKGVGKRIVKKAAEKWLPNDIIYAKKIGFGVSHLAWKNTRDFLKDGVLAQLFKWTPGNMDEICRQIYSDHLLPFHILSMEIWARIFFRGESAKELSERLLSVSQNAQKGTEHPQEAALLQ